MQLRILVDPQRAAVEAARIIAARAHEAVAQRGQFLMALSGGHTPWEMLRFLADLPLPWPHIHVFQVDERQAPPGHPDRNFTHLCAQFLSKNILPAPNLYPMPVNLPDLDQAAVQYSHTLQEIAGLPPVLDLIHLGLGADGHTASLLPGDPVLGEIRQDVAATDWYQGYRRLTLTYPMINRARTILWLVTGTAKAAALARLMAGDGTLPAGRIRRQAALVLADREAASRLPVPVPA